MTELETYKKERAPHRRLATISIKNSKTIIPETERGDYVAVLKGHLAIQRSKLTILEDLDSKIIGVIGEADMENEISDQNRYQMDIHMSIASIDDALARAIPVISAPSRSSSGSRSFEDERQVTEG